MSNEPSLPSIEQAEETLAAYIRAEKLIGMGHTRVGLACDAVLTELASLRRLLGCCSGPVSASTSSLERLLNSSVTDAILRAEGLSPGSSEARCAFLEVAGLEHSLASVYGADLLQGEIARRGAVTAALSAGEAGLAVHLCSRYLAEALSDAVRANLEELLAEGKARCTSAT